LSVVLAFLVRFEGALPRSNWAAVEFLWLPTTLALVTCYLLVGMYTRYRASSRAELLTMLVRGNALWLLASALIAYSLREFATAYPTAVVFLAPAFNATISYWIHVGWQRVRRHHFDIGRVRSAVLVGSTPEAKRLVEAASAQHAFQYRFVAALEDDRALDLGRVVRETGAEEVILANPSLDMRDLLHHLVQCAGLPVRFRVVPSIFEAIRAHERVTVVAGVPIVDLFGGEVPTMRDVARRIFDVALAGVGLAVTLPLWPLIALAVKVGSPGPVWYIQDRVGLHGRSFRLLKFRTMRADAEAKTGPVLATLDDRRITAVGRFLRATRCDELPQLVNVVVGDMSIVGPRPERPHFVRQFLKSVPAYAKRYSVRPGITGLAQVRGSYDISARNKVRYDLVYLENRSLLLDLKILAMTVGVVLSGRGAR
jgi:exopolysaccharide biosynthesis polyprenyl glycosylphosphotransferase